MALITTSNLPNLLRPGLNAVFGDYNVYPDEWRELFQYNTSNKASEWDQEMKLTPLASEKGEGESVVFEDMSAMYLTVYNHKWSGIGYIMTRSAIEDNLYQDMWPKGQIATRNSLAQYKNIMGSNIFNFGFGNQGIIADGQPLFSLNHPTDDGASPNTLSQAAQLNETALEDLIINIQMFKDAAGLLVAYKPRKLVVPVTLQFQADRLLGSKFRTETANNDISAMYNMGAIPQGYTVNHFLQGNNWYCLTTCDGLKYFMRTPVGSDSDTDTATSNLIVSTSERYSFGCSNFRSVAGVQGA
jgi:hypothetical protein